MAKRRSNSSGTLWIITAVLLLGFIAGLFYLQKHTAPTKSKARVSATSAKSEGKPKFDFYTVLPQGKQESSSAINGTAIPAPNNSATAGKYMLQVAAVKTFSDADRLKAQLLLQGFNVSIQKVKIGTTQWNRVNLGPYTTLSAAQSDQANLKKLNIPSILVKIKF